MKKIVLWSTGVVIALAWLSLGLGMAMDLERTTWVVWVTTVAVVTEIGIWLVAATLGVAVVQARKQIFGWFMRPFRSGA